MRWSKVKQLLEDLFDPALKLKIFCTVQRGEKHSIGRYWFVLDGDTIWDYPRNVSATLRAGQENQDATVIGSILRSYLDTPKEALLQACFEGDEWKLVDILRAADRRIGKRRLEGLHQTTDSEVVRRIIRSRGCWK